MGSKTLSSHFSLISIHEGGIALWRCGAVGELRAILRERGDDAKLLLSFWAAPLSAACRALHDWEQ